MPNLLKPKKIKKTKKLTNLPAKIKSAKTSPVDYYNCLLLKAQTGKKEKITQSCKDCKVNAPKVNQIRNSEISKLITSYHQVGESLKKLLKPIK
jgi:hypothetical protein